MATKRSSIHKWLILFFMILYIFAVQLSQATDTLLPNQSIRDGESLISANKTFELGFFSPGSSTNRYIGIWYNLSIRTVVWVANRNHPILDQSGFFTINEGGNLMIIDCTGVSLVVGFNTGKTNFTCATLLDSGNLVMRESNSIGDSPALWQSFDDPTDTFLSGMKLGTRNRVITSWRSSDDPGVGDFSFGIDPDGTDQFFIWQKGQVYWKSGEWNGTSYRQIPERLYFPDWRGYSSSIFRDSQWRTQTQDSSIIMRGVIDYSGQYRQLVWVPNSLEWILLWAQPKMFQCEVPSYCGANGICDNSTSPTCKCMSGFQPNSPKQWNSGTWSDGCVRKTDLHCGSSDGFVKLTSIKLPVNFTRAGDSRLGLADCRAKCVNNCSCTAYASENANGTGCLLWSQDLMGVQENISSVQEHLVRVDASHFDKAPVAAFDQEGKRVQLVIIIPVIVSVIVLLSVISICYFRWKKSKGNSETSQELLQLGIDSNPEWSNSLLDAIKNGKGEKGRGCTFINFITIAAATDNFSALNKIGAGGFGPVYRGTLGEHTIAVKRLSRGSGQGIVEFKNEITLIANLQHTNLVRILGYCIHKEEKLLIYEYMPNKSLDFYLFGRTKEVHLDWQKRFHIIEGIAQGLLYLHKYSRLRIIHRDLKTSNILLDAEMQPKISDFGMARIFGHNENQANTGRVAGTYGYMSPEYAMDGIFSTKSDVFSFGVVILEIVSGKKATNFELSGNSATLPVYAWELWNDGRGLELIDPSLGNIDPADEVSRCIHVALLCVQEQAADRPTMSDVLAMLCSEATAVPTPGPPAFSTVRTPSSSGQEICTSNDVTLTTIEGR